MNFIYPRKQLHQLPNDQEKHDIKPIKFTAVFDTYIRFQAKKKAHLPAPTSLSKM